MKKKNFKSLSLKKYSISNLVLLHNKNGGNAGADTGLTTTNIGNEPSVYPQCTLPNASSISDCNSSLVGDCECNTNTGTSKAQAPSEHQNCNANNDFYTGDST